MDTVKGNFYYRETFDRHSHSLSQISKKCADWSERCWKWTSSKRPVHNWSFIIRCLQWTAPQCVSYYYYYYYFYCTSTRPAGISVALPEVSLCFSVRGVLLWGFLPRWVEDLKRASHVVQTVKPSETKSVILGCINKLDVTYQKSKGKWMKWGGGREKQIQVKCTDGESEGVRNKRKAAAEGRQREGGREKGKAEGGTKVKGVEEGRRERRDEEKWLKHEGVEGWQERGGRGDGWDGRKERKPEIGRKNRRRHPDKWHNAQIRLISRMDRGR